VKRTFNTRNLALPSGSGRPREPVSYTVLNERHVPEVNRLWEDRLGAEQDRRQEWIEAVLSPNNPTAAIVATAYDEVVGFGICTITGKDWVQDYIDHPHVDVSVWESTGTVEAICVQREWESKGIASNIVQAELDYFRENDGDGAIAVSWHRDDHIDSRPLFRKFGFEPACIRERFYAESNDDPQCIDCKRQCDCGATVFILPLSGLTDD